MSPQPSSTTLIRSDQVVRPMIPADTPAVSAVLADAWKDSYSDWLPSAAVSRAAVARRATILARQLRSGSPAQHLVGTVNGAVCGFAIVGPGRDEDCSTGDAELFSLYVAPHCSGSGLGRSLLRRCVSEARALGCTRLLVWVLKDNRERRAFFRRCGLRQDSVRAATEFGGTALTKVRYSMSLTGATPAF
ncbi:MAG: GNAT family N-acetyltransferase [Bowdeniella nasicola]|nr:GNAT family N-acetyltransferase [Bowdeniella nasicola]